MAQIRAAGIKSDLWTYSKFLSKHPIKNTYAVIETPETAGLNLTDAPSEIGDVQGVIATPLTTQATSIIPVDLGTK